MGLFDHTSSVATRMADPTIPVDLSSEDELARSIVGAIYDCPELSSDKLASYIAAALWPKIRPAGWRLVPETIAPEQLAIVAVHTDDGSPADFDVARAALQFLPPSSNPDVADVLADIARDWRNGVAAAPTYDYKA